MKLVYNFLVKKILLLSLLIFASTLSVSSQADDSAIKIFFVDPVNKQRIATGNESESIKALKNLIDNSTQSIDFAIYGISNQEIFDALKSAKQRGVKVRGVVDFNNNQENPYSLTYKLIEEFPNTKTDYKKVEDFKIKSSDYVQQVKYYFNKKVVNASFVNKGIKDYNDKIMHNKYFIVDNKYVWTGSMNVSNSCSTYNANSSILINSPELARLYKEDFELMYLNSKFHKDKDYRPTPQTVSLKNSKVTAFLLPEDNTAYEQISEYINKAEKYIYVPMFFFTHTKYPQDLINAYNRGVDVRVIIDATSVRTGYSKHQIMRMAGIPVKVENWGGKMHMKSLIIDDKYLLIGSMNFTAGAHYQNDENCLLIEDSNTTIQARKNFEYMWDSIPNKWLKSEPKPEGKDSKYSCSDGIDNDHDDLIDEFDPDCRAIRLFKKEYTFSQVGPFEP